jgi:hypothetical protein
MPLIFLTGLFFGLLFGGSSLPNELRIRRAKVEGRSYRVSKRGGGAYEVFREDLPTVFVMLNQTGETAASAAGPELEQLRADMRKFPSNLFS